MRLLLHVCCAPCLIYPLERLKEKKYQVTGFFYNPNIHPFGEYGKRKQALADFSAGLAAEVLYPEYRPAEFFRSVNGGEDRPGRCLVCWELRLKKTAEFAAMNGFTAFSTTLLVSPYQDQQALSGIGRRVSQDSGVEFYYEDFRPGFRKAHNEAKQQNIYCQNYCGCIYSEVERCRR